MSYASTSLAHVPPLFPPLSAAARHRLRLLAEAAAIAAQSLVMAGVLWLVVAAPGLLADRPSIVRTAHR